LTAARKQHLRRTNIERADSEYSWAVIDQPVSCSVLGGLYSRTTTHTHHGLAVDYYPRLCYAPSPAGRCRHRVQRTSNWCAVLLCANPTSVLGRSAGAI